MDIESLIPWHAATVARAVVCAAAVASAASAQPSPGVSVDVPAPIIASMRSDTLRPGVSDADVKFMQGMIAHHAQAVTMSALVPSRTSRNELHLLAQRIDVSQKDEIKLMQRWLRERHQDVPGTEAQHEHHDAGHDVLMPGMLTPAEMDALRDAKGIVFERLFLQGMIRHHEGALTMVKQLFATKGGGQDTEIFRFASDVDADQRAEIARMQKLLAATPEGGGRP